MTEKKTYRKIADDDPRLRLASLLYRYMSSEEACEKAGLPTDESMRRKVSSANPQYGWKKLPLALEPISHVTLIADGWEFIDYHYGKGNFLITYSATDFSAWHESEDDSDFVPIGSALTIGELRSLLNSLSL